MAIHTDKITLQKKIWRIAGPAIIANSTTPLVGLVDTAIIGHLPSAVHLAAIGIGATFFNFLFWSLGFLRMGTTGSIAQAYGRNDQKEISNILLRSLVIGGSISVIILIASPWLIKAGLHLLEAPDTVAPYAQTYMTIRIWSAPAALFNYALLGYLIGTGRTDKALVVQILLNSINLILNLFFVLVLEMGVAGIAAGSLMAETIAALFAMVLIHKKLGTKTVKTAINTAENWKFKAYRALVSVNGYIFVRTLMLITTFSLVTRFAAQLGAFELATTQILLTFTLLISLGLDGMAYASEALGGQAKGRKNRSEFRRIHKATGSWALAIALIYSAIFLVFGETIVTILTDLAPIKKMAGDMILLIAATPIIAASSYHFDGIFIAASESKAMMITMAGAFMGFLATADMLSRSFGLPGLWSALLLFLGFRGILQAIYYPKLERNISHKKLSTQSV